MKVDYLLIPKNNIFQGYSPIDIFRLAEDFFVSMNFSALPIDFWSGSLLQEPLDRAVLCQPSAWDFCNREDFRYPPKILQQKMKFTNLSYFRIKMCAHISMKDLITAHHELGHIHYFMQYKYLPKAFRDGANPG